MRVDRSALALGSAVIALGVLLLSGVTEISEGVGYDRIGPRLFPYAVAVGLFVLGALVAFPSSARPTDPLPIQRLPLAYVTAAFLLFLVLMHRAGFVVAAAVQFWLIARALRSTRPLGDAIAAVTLSAIVYLTFSRGLGLELPPVPFAGGGE